MSRQDYGVTPFAKGSDAAAIARELDAYNATAQAAVAAAAYAHPLLHLRFVDITGLSRTYPTLLARDGASGLAHTVLSLSGSVTDALVSPSCSLWVGRPAPIW